MTRLLCVRLGAGPSSATLVNLHIVRRVALSQVNIWSSDFAIVSSNPNIQGGAGWE
jgi:hypothetical protein